MSLTKTTTEIDAMREGGHLLSRALKAACDAVRPGVTLPELDAIATRVIREGGGEPSFMGYKSHPEDKPFPSTMCISVNEEVVHGRGDRPIALKEGDIVGLDIGLWYKGLCTDMAATVPVGTVSEEALTRPGIRAEKKVGSRYQTNTTVMARTAVDATKRGNANVEPVALVSHTAMKGMNPPTMTVRL